MESENEMEPKNGAIQRTQSERSRAASYESVKTIVNNKTTSQKKWIEERRKNRTIYLMLKIEEKKENTESEQHILCLCNVQTSNR